MNAKCNPFEYGGVWNTISFKHDINDKLKINCYYFNSVREDNGVSDWYVQAGLKQKVNKIFSIEGMFRKAYYRISEGWTYENRSMIRLGAKFKLAGWYFRNRQRFEYRLFENSKSRFRYRTDLTVKPDWKFSKLSITPYIREEAFIYKQEFSKMRSYFGLSGIKGNLAPSFYCLIQSKKDIKSFQHTLILGFSMGINI